MGLLLSNILEQKNQAKLSGVWIEPNLINLISLVNECEDENIDIAIISTHLTCGIYIFNLVDKTTNDVLFSYISKSIEESAKIFTMLEQTKPGRLSMMCSSLEIME